MEKKELAFMAYWEQHRDKEKKSWRQLMIGLPMGLVFAIPILIGFFSGKYWYKRADMVGNAQSNPTVLVIAVLAITVFVAVFYKKHQFDLKDQYYKELKRKAEKLQQIVKTEQNATTV